MDFYQLLILFSIGIFLIVSTIMIRKRGDIDSSERKIQIPYFHIYFSVYFLLVVLSGYYALMGKRTWLWFTLYALYTVFSIFYAKSEMRSHRNFAAASIIIMAISLSVIPNIQNQGVIFGPDQWRDLEVTTFIVNEETFYRPGGSGYYSLIPLFNVINAVFTIFTGMEPMTVLSTIQMVYSTIAILSLYLIVEKLSGSRETSFIALAVFLSTPRLTTIQAIPAVASISLGIFLIFFMIEVKTSLLYVIPFIAFTTSVMHPIGVIPVLTVILGIISLGNLISRYRVPMQIESYLRLIFTICFLVTIVYWSIDTRVLTGVFNPFNRLFEILISRTFTPSVYTPQYQESGFLQYAFSWALPVGITAVYILVFILNERTSNLKRSEFVSNFHVSSAFIAIFLIIISFLSVLLSPGASLERYINVPAYLLMIFPTALILSNIISSRNKTFMLIGLSLLMVNSYIGTSSPNWAPFETPAFGSLRSTYFGYIEAQDIVTTLPSGIRVYEDNDISVFSVASLKGLELLRDQSYQTIRSVIDNFKSNNVDYDNQRLRNSIIFLRTREIIDQELLLEPIDVVYNNGFHSGLRTSNTK